MKIPKNITGYARAYCNFQLRLLTEFCSQHQAAKPELRHGHFNECITCSPQGKRKNYVVEETNFALQDRLLGSCACRLQAAELQNKQCSVGACRCFQSLVERWQYVFGTKFKINLNTFFGTKFRINLNTFFGTKFRINLNTLLVPNLE